MRVQHKIRVADQDDLEFLVAMAKLFGHTRNSDSVKGWLQEGRDFGLIAEDPFGEKKLGAAWWRQFHESESNALSCPAPTVPWSRKPWHRLEEAPNLSVCRRSSFVPSIFTVVPPFPTPSQ